MKYLGGSKRLDALQLKAYALQTLKPSPHRFRADLVAFGQPVNWRKPDGNYGRRRFSSESVEEAISRAPEVAGLRGSAHRQDDAVEMQKAFEETLAQTRRNAQTRKDWLTDQVRFMEWLAKHYPDCSHWHLLSRQMLREYIQETFAGRSANRIRLAMQPITQTAGYIAREHRVPNVAERLGFGHKLVKTPPMVFVTDVAAFVDWIPPGVGQSGRKGSARPADSPVQGPGRRAVGAGAGRDTLGQSFELF